MKIDKIFVEKKIEADERTQAIISRISHTGPILTIESIEEIFGKSRKPYIDKFHNLNAFIGEKKGTITKLAPPAYGMNTGKHYYFIHAYNCPLACEYCYLQGYFKSPDLVFFTNYEDIASSIEKTIDADKKIGEDSFFHAGEFSDNLVLSHITEELDYLWPVFARHPESKLELRSKSANIKKILALGPLPNITISFSMASQQAIRRYDTHTSPLRARIGAIAKLQKLGFPIGLHLDPIIYSPTIEEEYESLCEELADKLDISKLQYISIGVLRFTKESYRETRRNYQHSGMFSYPMAPGFDDKMRYPVPIHNGILNYVENRLIHSGVNPAIIYRCMES